MFRIGDEICWEGRKPRAPEYVVVAVDLNSPSGVYTVRKVKSNEVYPGCKLTGYVLVNSVSPAEAVLRKMALMEERWKNRYEE